MDWLFTQIKPRNWWRKVTGPVITFRKCLILFAHWCSIIIFTLHYYNITKDCLNCSKIVYTSVRHPQFLYLTNQMKPAAVYVQYRLLADGCLCSQLPQSRTTLLFNNYLANCMHYESCAALKHCAWSMDSCVCVDTMWKYSMQVAAMSLLINLDHGFLWTKTLELKYSRETTQLSEILTQWSASWGRSLCLIL